MLQLPTLKSLSQYSSWWVVVSTIGWGIAMLPLTFVAYMVLGGIELGVLSGIYVFWLLKFPLEEHNVVTVEPGLYDPKIGGVRIEDVVEVTKKGCNNLTEMEICLEV